MGSNVEKVRDLQSRAFFLRLWVKKQLSIGLFCGQKGKNLIA